MHQDSRLHVLHMQHTCQEKHVFLRSQGLSGASDARAANPENRLCYLERYDP